MAPCLMPTEEMVFPLPGVPFLPEGANLPFFRGHNPGNFLRQVDPGFLPPLKRGSVLGRWYSMPNLCGCM